MKKCSKKLDELCDKTSELEDTIQSLKSLTKEIIRLQKKSKIEPVTAARR